MTILRCKGMIFIMKALVTFKLLASQSIKDFF